jgi:predicted RNA methylase
MRGVRQTAVVTASDQAYQRAIARAVKRKQEEDGEAHCLDIGAGSGLLAVMAAQAGASSVVACELHDGLAAVARRVRLRLACPAFRLGRLTHMIIPCALLMDV